MARYMTVEQVAERLQVQASTVRSWIKNGELAARKIGERRLYRIPVEELDKFEAKYD